MSDETHMVILPGGDKRGPFSAEVLQDLLHSGGLPAESTLVIGELSVPLPEGIELLLKRPRRASASARAEQGGTQAETPQAISRAAAQSRNVSED